MQRRGRPAIPVHASRLTCEADPPDINTLTGRYALYDHGLLKGVSYRDGGTESGRNGGIDRRHTAPIVILE